MTSERQVAVKDVRAAVLLLAKKADAIRADAAKHQGSVYLQGASEATTKLVAILLQAIKGW